MSDKNEKTTKAFTEAIKSRLMQIAVTDPLFAKSLEKPNKNIEDCIQYILNTVQKSGRIGFTDDEVYSMAVHYYDEDNIDIGKPMDCFVVVNKPVELTEEDKEEARKKAIQDLIDKEKQRMTTPAKKEKAKVIPIEQQPSLF